MQVELSRHTTAMNPPSRRRHHLRMLALVLLVLAGALGAQPSTAWSPAPAPAVADRSQVVPLGLTESCGPGHVGGFVPSLSAVACVHQAHDLPVRTVATTSAPSVAPKCHGNGVNGNRVQLIYAYVEGRPNRAASVVPTIIREYVPRMEAAFRTTSREQGREIGIRFHAPGCKLSVDVVKVSRESADPAGPGGNFYDIISEISAQGYDKATRKYHVWMDGPSGGPCGVGTALMLPVLPISPFDNPTPLNPSNLGQTPLFPSYAVTYRSPVGTPYGNTNPCWGNGAMGALTETHELLHTLGAVQMSAPNSNGRGHCRDENDIMCYPEGGVKTFVRCNSRLELLDCGQDDYFSARPALGGYLSTHWNIANSSFLGPALGLDDIPIQLPVV